MTGDGIGFTMEARGEREIVMACVLPAPPERVFAAWTDCAGMRHWYGPEAHELIVCEQDLRAGGRWRFVTRDADGVETGLLGVYREVAPPRRIVNTEAWEGMPDVETVVTSTFEAEDGGTRFTAVVLHPSAETRAGALESGMEWGARQTFERLAAHLATLPA